MWGLWYPTEPVTQGWGEDGLKALYFSNILLLLSRSVVSNSPTP